MFNCFCRYPWRSQIAMDSPPHNSSRLLITARQQEYTVLPDCRVSSCPRFLSSVASVYAGEQTVCHSAYGRLPGIFDSSSGLCASDVVVSRPLMRRLAGLAGCVARPCIHRRVMNFLQVAWKNSMQSRIACDSSLHSVQRI